MSDRTQREIAARIATRYRWPSHRSYIRGKLRWDPLFPAIAPLLVDSPRRIRGACYWPVEVRASGELWKRFFVSADGKRVVKD